MWSRSPRAPSDVPPTASLPSACRAICALLFGAVARLRTCFAARGGSVRQVYKQTHTENMSYLAALRNVLADGGVTGLMFRGLGTKVSALSTLALAPCLLLTPLRPAQHRRAERRASVAQSNGEAACVRADGEAQAERG